METNSSGEDPVAKMRKPYTITKQREKWTEEEHNKFIEALKLYGRAWQRIEEHIGTKTAVQIRSHAQKFFTKLEKEALLKGVPLGQAHDIEIPPPRPKRKPSSPYPRKAAVGSLSSSVEALEERTSKSLSLNTSNQAIDIDSNQGWKAQGTKDYFEDGSCSEVLSLFRDGSASSVSSLTKVSSGICAFKDFMPLKKDMDMNGLDRSSMSIDVKRDVNGSDKENATHGGIELKGSYPSSGIESAEEISDKSKPTVSMDPLTDNMFHNQGFTKHVPIDFMKKSSDSKGPATGAANAKQTCNPANPPTSEMNSCSGLSSVHVAFPPFAQFPQDTYRSFLNISSAFSSLVVSTLLQNPAVHAAATMAASFWPSAGLDASVDSSSETVQGGIPARHMNPSPNMAAIAAATVAAASAWWATHGLLPMYPPLHTGFAFAPAPTSTNLTGDMVRAPDSRKEQKSGMFENPIGADQQDVDPEQSEALRAKNPLSKQLSTSLTSDSEESARGELAGAKTDKPKPVSINGVNVKKAYRSSCGSNTPSSSDVETDVVLEKQDGGKEEETNVVHLDNNPPAAETIPRRTRSNASSNDLWKEVSEEGRLAFQALFMREILPQSFSPPHMDSIVMTSNDKGVTSRSSPVDLNMNAASEQAEQAEQADICHAQISADAVEIVPLTSEINPVKLKTRRMGFKPYKRCSVEAKESRGTAGEEAGNKRIRLEGEASI